MPSGRTHDVITILLATPVAFAAYSATRNAQTAAVVATAFIFGGLMFGPDLDTVSRQYSRWSFFKSLWIPYRHFFQHRSRFSHGLLFGALFRVIYFLGVLTAVSFAAIYAWSAYFGGKLPNLFEFSQRWQSIGAFIELNLGDNALLFTFLGLWLGAASHTVTDMAVTFAKTGRSAKFF